ncbi:HD domain-containing protein [Streptomyces sp. YIM 98790]|uniref:HD domain-containing protein n=1 Tax=Streptomyces sp. YIM 98790 TaxID=2689077 RepID=UPI00140CF522|nr:HD domain-containing protein [Streptomyces sp. YIM 98790]
MDVPAEDEIRALHEEHAPSAEALELVHGHCVQVWRIAEQLIARGGLAVDAELVRAGCLLHDIGVYRLYDRDGRLDHRNYVRHGILGHELLAAAGYPEELCRFCSCHTGTGLTRADIIEQHLPLPPVDHVAKTAEERLVMYADKFHTKSAPHRLLTFAEYAAFIGGFGAHKVAAFAALRDEFGLPGPSSAL